MSTIHYVTLGISILVKFYDLLGEFSSELLFFRSIFIHKEYAKIIFPVIRPHELNKDYDTIGDKL